MSNAGLAALDRKLHARFAASGYADAGTYVPKLGAAQTCKIYIVRDTLPLELSGFELRAGSVLVHMLREGIAVPPEQGARINCGADSFKVESILRSDESKWELVCLP